jgi:hypothetical protein
MSAPVETIEALTNRARAAMKKTDEYQITAGVVLTELKQRISNKESNEGEPWGWSFKFYIQKELKKSYSHAQRLIGIVANPQAEAELKRQRAERAQAEKERRAAAKAGLPRGRPDGEPDMRAVAQRLAREYAREDLQELVELLREFLEQRRVRAAA